MNVQSISRNHMNGSSAEGTQQKAGEERNSEAVDQRLAQLVRELEVKQLQMTQEIVDGTSRAVSNAQQFLSEMPADLKSGMNSVRNMFIIQFCLGIALLISAVVFQFLGKEILTILFGVSGGLTVLTLLILSPPLRLQKNRVDLAQWGMSYFNWFNSTLSVTNVMNQSLASGNLDWETFKNAHELLLDITQRSMQHIDNHCEFTTPVENGIKES